MPPSTCFFGSDKSAAEIRRFITEVHKRDLSKFSKVLTVGNSGVGKSFLSCYFASDPCPPPPAPAAAAATGPDEVLDVPEPWVPLSVFEHKVCPTGVTSTCERVCVVFPSPLHGLDGIIVYNIPGLVETGDAKVKQNVAVFKQAAEELHVECKTAVIFVLNVGNGGRWDAPDNVAFSEAQKVLKVSSDNVVFVLNNLNEDNYETPLDWIREQALYERKAADCFGENNKKVKTMFFPTVPKKPRQTARENKTMKEERVKAAALAQVVATEILLTALHRAVQLRPDVSAKMRLLVKDRVFSEEELEELDFSGDEEMEEMLAKQRAKLQESVEEFEKDRKAMSEEYKSVINQVTAQNKQLEENVETVIRNSKKSSGGFWATLGSVVLLGCGVAISIATKGAVNIYITL